MPPPFNYLCLPMPRQSFVMMPITNKKDPIIIYTIYYNQTDDTIVLCQSEQNGLPINNTQKTFYHPSSIKQVHAYLHSLHPDRYYHFSLEKYTSKIQGQAIIHFDSRTPDIITIDYNTSSDQPDTIYTRRIRQSPIRTETLPVHTPMRDVLIHTNTHIHQYYGFVLQNTDITYEQSRLYQKHYVSERIVMVIHAKADIRTAERINMVIEMYIDHVMHVSTSYHVIEPSPTHPEAPNHLPHVHALYHKAMEQFNDLPNNQYSQHEHITLFHQFKNLATADNVALLSDIQHCQQNIIDHYPPTCTTTPEKNT